MNKKMGVLIWALSLGYKSVRIKESDGHTRLLTGWGNGGLFGKFMVVFVWWLIFGYICDFVDMFLTL